MPTWNLSNINGDISQNPWKFAPITTACQEKQKEKEKRRKAWKDYKEKVGKHIEKHQKVIDKTAENVLPPVAKDIGAGIEKAAITQHVKGSMKESIPPKPYSAGKHPRIGSENAIGTTRPAIAKVKEADVNKIGIPTMVNIELEEKLRRKPNVQRFEI